jgi:hypothetical protein
MLENIIIAGLFVGALGYVGNIIRRSFEKKESGCAKGCGTCAVSNTSLQKPM